MPRLERMLQGEAPVASNDDDGEPKTSVVAPAARAVEIPKKPLTIEELRFLRSKRFSPKGS